jgi:hypothetical protein
VQSLGFDGSDPGGLYRALRSLEKEKLVRSFWEPSDRGPARRTYEITRQGMEELHRAAKRITRGHETVGASQPLSEFVALPRSTSTRGARAHPSAEDRGCRQGGWETTISALLPEAALSALIPSPSTAIRTQLAEEPNSSGSLPRFDGDGLRPADGTLERKGARVGRIGPHLAFGRTTQETLLADAVARESRAC